MKNQNASVRKGTFLILITAVLACLLMLFSAAAAQSEDDMTQIAISYCTVDCDSRPIMTDYSDQWLLKPPDSYNHKLMQASFVLAASAFRDKTRDYDQKDFNIRNFFSRAGFTEPRTDDYDHATSGDTIASAIAHKEVDGITIIAVAVSGNNYQDEWLSNFNLSDQVRAEGFDRAAQKVLDRIKAYILDRKLYGKPLRLWITGYSRAAAIANIAAADATDSGLFEAVYGYTIGTPRTTREEDAGRYANIFNVLNPFDPVPLIPFPEWGYKRYGVDLYLPALETDSRYIDKIGVADEISMKVTGNQARFNPLINAQLHTLLDYLLFYVRSAYSYKENFQSAVIDLWQTHEYKQMLNNIAKQIGDLGNVTLYQMKEFYYFLDFLCLVAYTSFRGQAFNPDDLYWDPGIPIQENLMHEHYDSAYLAWIFAFDEPEMIVSPEPGYYHYTIIGDVDVELFDGNGGFIEAIRSDGQISMDSANVQAPGFTGNYSDTILYAKRDGAQTLIILPKDQNYSATIISHADQNIRCSLVEYSAGAIQANVRYIYHQNMNKGDFHEGVISRAVVDNLTEADLLEQGFYVEEPWSQQNVYSPSAIMRLESDEIFHPSPLIFLTLSGLSMLMGIYLLILFGIGIHKIIKREIRRIRARKIAQNHEEESKA